MPLPPVETLSDASDEPGAGGALEQPKPKVKAKAKSKGKISATKLEEAKAEKQSNEGQTEGASSVQVAEEPEATQPASSKAKAKGKAKSKAAAKKRPAAATAGPKKRPAAESTASCEGQDSLDAKPIKTTRYMYRASQKIGIKVNGSEKATVTCCSNVSRCRAGCWWLEHRSWVDLNLSA